jgi:hypothetical protein
MTKHSCRKLAAPLAQNRQDRIVDAQLGEWFFTPVNCEKSQAVPSTNDSD